MKGFSIDKRQAKPCRLFSWRKQVIVEVKNAPLTNYMGSNRCFLQIVNGIFCFEEAVESEKHLLGHCAHRNVDFNINQISMITVEKLTLK